MFSVTFQLCCQDLTAFRWLLEQNWIEKIKMRNILPLVVIQGITCSRWRWNLVCGDSSIAVSTFKGFLFSQTSGRRIKEHSPTKVMDEVSDFSKTTWLFANNKPMSSWNEKHNQSLVFKPVLEIKLLKWSQYSIYLQIALRVPWVSCQSSVSPSGCWHPWPQYLLSAN